MTIVFRQDCWYRPTRVNTEYVQNSPFAKQTQQWSASRASFAAPDSLPRKFSACSFGDIRTRISVAIDTPPSFGGLGDEHPRSLGERRYRGRGRYDFGQLANHAELLFAIEAPTGVSTWTRT
jgi:hypothetical protein